VGSGPTSTCKQTEERVTSFGSDKTNRNDLRATSKREKESSRKSAGRKNVQGKGKLEVVDARFRFSTGRGKRGAEKTTAQSAGGGKNEEDGQEGGGEKIHAQNDKGLIRKDYRPIERFKSERLASGKGNVDVTQTLKGKGFLDGYSGAAITTRVNVELCNVAEGLGIHEKKREETRWDLGSRPRGCPQCVSESVYRITDDLLSPDAREGGGEVIPIHSSVRKRSPVSNSHASSRTRTSSTRKRRTRVQREI